MLIRNHSCKKEILKNNYIEVAFILLLLVNLVKIIPPYEWMSDFWRSYILNYYVLSYQSAGCFVSRGFVGSVLQLFLSSINTRTLYACLWGIYFLTYSILGIYIIKKIKLVNESYVAIVGMILFCPAIMNYANDFGRPDIFLIWLVIISMLLIYKGKLLFLVPLLSIVGMLIHEGYIVFFIPSIVMYFLYKFCREKRINYIVYAVLTAFASLVTFYLVFKYGKESVNDVNLLFNKMQERIDTPLNPNMTSFEFGDMKQTLSTVSFDELSQYKTWIGLLFYILLFFPIYQLYFKIFNNFIKNKQYFVLVRLLYTIAPFSGLLMILVGVDYGRWISMVITTLIINGLFYLKEIQYDVENLTIRRSVWYVFWICIYLVIGPMGDIHEHFGYLNGLNSIFNYIVGA